LAPADHSDRDLAPPGVRDVDVIVVEGKWRPPESTRGDGRRADPAGRRFVLPRSPERHRPVAIAARGGHRRAGRPGYPDVGQFWRLACAVDAVARPALASAAAPAFGCFECRGCRSLVTGAAQRQEAERRGSRARRARAAAALWRGLLALDRARSVALAAMAGALARLSP